MSRFRMKPVEIEAIQYIGDNIIEIKEWGPLDEIGLHWMRVGPGDWIIKGEDGEFRGCKSGTFAATYEALEVET